MNPIGSPAQLDPASTAVIVGRDAISYGRFAADVAHMAGWLADQGLRPGQRLGIFLNRKYYWAWVAHIAALRLGLTHATLTVRHWRQEIAACAALDVALGEFGGVDRRAFATRTIEFSPSGRAPLAAQLGLAPAPGPGPDALAESEAQRLVFTSGTTGRKKVVAWDAPMLRARVALVQDARGLQPSSRLMSLLGMDTTGGYRYPLATWQAGGCVVAPVAGAWTSATARESLGQCHVLVLSPQQLRFLLERLPQPWQGRDARKLIVAGGRLPKALRDTALRVVCGEITIAYGATETGSIASGDAGLLERHPGAVGFAVAGASVQIVDRDGGPAPPGREGIVRTRTRYMVQGYERAQADAQENPFRDGWFHPGDQGMLLDDGLLVITGRTSESLNIGGLKISAVDLEEELRRLPAIRDLCAVVLKLPTGDQLAVAVVCDKAVDLRALSREISARLPPSMAFRLLRTPAIERNAMGKIARDSIAGKLAARIARRGRSGVHAIEES